jgi:hypothetical protein
VIPMSNTLDDCDCWDVHANLNLDSCSCQCPCHQKAIEPRHRENEVIGLNEPCTTSSGYSERCQNPICGNPVEPIKAGWRRTERLYCSDKCRQDASLIRRVAAVLVPLGKEQAWKALGVAIND